jgi:hypothetical protein
MFKSKFSVLLDIVLFISKTNSGSGSGLGFGSGSGLGLGFGLGSGLGFGSGSGLGLGFGLGSGSGSGLSLGFGLGSGLSFGSGLSSSLNSSFFSKASNTSTSSSHQETGKTVEVFKSKSLTILITSFSIDSTILDSTLVTFSESKIITGSALELFTSQSILLFKLGSFLTKFFSEIIGLDLIVLLLSSVTQLLDQHQVNTLIHHKKRICLTSSLVFILEVMKSERELIFFFEDRFSIDHFTRSTSFSWEI